MRAQAMDRGNSSDPFLLCKLGKEKKKTKKIKATCNPYFGELFEFQVPLPGVAKLELEVWDRATAPVSYHRYAEFLVLARL